MADVPTLADLTEALPLAPENSWNDDGYVLLPGFLPDDLIDEYCARWLLINGAEVPPRMTGWPDAVPYTRHPALRELCTYGPLARILEDLLHEPAGVHLNLTGWVTTGRDWHQDSYLNPPHVGDHYAAVWFALGDIDPLSGPFQAVPGSHRWPVVTQEKIARHYDLEDKYWPTQSEELLTPLFSAELERRGCGVYTHLPKRGDVLIWHSRLVHRGSQAITPGLERRALIAHYSGIHHREDMPPARQTESGGWLFPLDDVAEEPITAGRWTMQRRKK